MSARKWENSSGGAPTHVRNRILKRDNHTCQECGGTGTEVDHIDNTRNENYTHDSNLQTLCESCHWRKTLREIQVGQQRRRDAAKFPGDRHPGMIW